MARQGWKLLLVVLAGFALFALARSAAGQYRGAPAGWPQNAGGYYSAYPVSGNGQAYYVARPGMPAQRPAAIAYVPVNASYVNPNYFGAYATTRAAYRPQAVAYNPQATMAYYPQQPAAANYAPSSGYAISPAGSSYAGSEAAAYFGQPAPINYVPPRVTYRPAYAATPVYAYQPVAAYQVGAQPTTCYQPAPAPVASGCGAPKSCHRGFLSWLNPFNWFRRRGCGSAPTTAYCGQTSVVQCGTAGACGQPYYPTQPTTIIPTYPAPATTVPTIRSPILGTPTVPPPPTRSGPTTIVPAETRPTLPATPGGSFTPSGGFGVPPAGTSGGSFPSGSNYAPEVDPYTVPTVPSISGANFRGSSQSRTIVEPDLNEADGRVLPPSVKPIPDPDADLRRQSPSRAPQLLDPRDKSASARRDRWAVVPAVWPTAQRGGRVVSHTSEASPYLQNASNQQPAHAYEPVRRFVPSAEAAYDDGGWQSAR